MFPAFNRDAARVKAMESWVGVKLAIFSISSRVARKVAGLTDAQFATTLATRESNSSAGAAVNCRARTSPIAGVSPLARYLSSSSSMASGPRHHSLRRVSTSFVRLLYQIVRTSLGN